MLNRVMITGTRDLTPDVEFLMTFALNWTASYSEKDCLLLQGGARGVDRAGKQIWNSYGLPDKVFEADWEKYNNAAGGIRNQEMVDYNPEICLAFPGPESKGTWDAIRRAKQARILTFVLQDKDSMYKLYYYTVLNPGVPLE